MSQNPVSEVPRPEIEEKSTTAFLSSVEDLVERVLSSTKPPDDKEANGSEP